jgi:predicted RNA-binding protein with PIN domain
MAYLIDGYNLMHAMVDVRPRLRPDELQRLRQRFLNDLARRLGPLAASQTTVVFDASRAPASGTKAGRHQGMTIRFAPDADDWIESALDARGSPKPGWVVVSSDRRIREAARRKRVASQTTDQFLNGLEDGRPALRFEGRPAPGAAPPPDRPAAPSGPEAAFWHAEFRDLIAADEANRTFRRSDFVPTDEEIARIEREVEREGG